MRAKRRLSDLIRLSPRYTRSVNLERDMYSPETMEGYVMTAGANEALQLLRRGVDRPSYRAQCLTGPYGSGKSALALWFAMEMSNSVPMGGRSRRQHGHLLLLVTGSREPLLVALCRGIERSLKRNGNAPLWEKWSSRLNVAREAGAVGGRMLVDMLEGISHDVVRGGHGAGIVVIVDELGKLLEYAALHPEESDLFLLQEIAEAASRSHEAPLWIVTVLHQAFSHYAWRLGKRQQQEWAKVQQRFYEVPLRLDGRDAFQLMAAALSADSGEVADNRQIRACAARGAEMLMPAHADEFAAWASDSYPLHPTVMFLLPALFRRYGQNERSLFSFLSADEPYSLVDWMRDQPFEATAPPYLRLPQLYDYAGHMLFTGSGGPGAVRGWAEIDDALSQAQDDPNAQDALKTIGLLGLVGESARLPATPELLRLSLTSQAGKHDDVGTTLEALQRRRIIVYRRFRRSYRLWEGSDVDVDERLEQAYPMAPREGLSLNVARELCPSEPVVARRHSFRTGNLRVMEVTPCDTVGLVPLIQDQCVLDGRLVQCLLNSQEEAREAEAVLSTCDDPSRVVSTALASEEITEAAREVWALEWVRQHTPELASDRAARRELSDRLLEAETTFRREWERLMGPGSRVARWFWKGAEVEVVDSRARSSLLSAACDETYFLAPVVQNELINRRQLSSAAAAARRRLVEAMLTQGHLPMLGLTGYPPERAIYDSVLLRGGVHIEGHDGTWRFARPSGTDPGLQSAWDHILSCTEAEDLEPRSVAEVFDQLAGPPWGVSPGFLPVLLTACLLANQETMALYHEGGFVPELTPATMELLMKRPEQFGLLHYTVSGERRAVVKRFARGFSVDVGVLPVVRHLYRMLASLNRYAETTRTISPEARKVRDAIARARRPEQLLWVELPEALRLPPFSANAAHSPAKVNRFFERLNQAFSDLASAYPMLLDRVRRGLLEVFAVEDGPQWRQGIIGEAAVLLEIASDVRLKALLVRAADSQMEETAYLESIGSAVVGPPPSRWSASEEERFTRLLPGLAEEVGSARGMHILREGVAEGQTAYLVSIQSSAATNIRKPVRLTTAQQGRAVAAAKEVVAKLTGALGPDEAWAALAETARMLDDGQMKKRDGAAGEGQKQY